MHRLAIITVSIMLIATAADALASGGSWRTAQMRMRYKYQRELQQESAFWKKFDKEMAQTAKQLNSGPMAPSKRGYDNSH